MPDRFCDTIVVTGHYGSGKTNLSFALALDYRRRGCDVVLVDLDVVNPYFRTADFKEIAKEKGISLLASEYAGSNLDLPALSGTMDAAIGTPGKTVIIDVGGDDAGAIALGRYSTKIKQLPYTMLYVVNAFRYLMRDPHEAAALLTDIEKASRLRATHIVNNSNLSIETTAGDVRGSLGYAHEVSSLTGLPLAFTSVRTDLAPQLSGAGELYPMEIHVCTPWTGL